MAFSLTGILAVLLEFLRPFLLPLAVVAVIELILIVVLVLRRGTLRVRPAVRLAAGLGVAAAVLTTLLLPPWTGAGLAQLSGLLDYAAVIGGGIGLGVAAGLALYPPLQLFFRRP
ncbi:MAG: hypothetical protein JJT90_05910 [Ectothiorhodospiraceae bacterium]|nr:hypothetical protein [Ectothiorhodospiraceae bacterium]